MLFQDSQGSLVLYDTHIERVGSLERAPYSAPPTGQPTYLQQKQQQHKFNQQQRRYDQQQLQQLYAQQQTASQSREKSIYFFFFSTLGFK